MEESKIASAVPTIDHRLCSKVGTVEVALEQGIALDENLSDMEGWKVSPDSEAMRARFSGRRRPEEVNGIAPCCGGGPHL